MSTTADLTGLARAKAAAKAGANTAIDAVVEAWADNDADAFAACYADDASVVLASGTHLRSREEIRAYMSAGFAGPMRGSSCADVTETVRVLGSGVAVIVGISTILAAGETSVRPDRELRATWVISQHDDVWLVDAYHNCAARPGAKTV